MTEAKRRSVRLLYDGVDMRKFTALVRLPCRDNIYAAICLLEFLASVKLVLGEVLIVANDEKKQSFDAPSVGNEMGCTPPNVLSQGSHPHRPWSYLCPVSSQQLPLL